MGLLRFAFILFLTVALDLSVPVPQHTIADAVEEFEEVVHGLRGPRPLRQARGAVAPSMARFTAGPEIQRPLPRATTPAPVPAPVAPIRKLPPSLAESSSAPDAH